MFFVLPAYAGMIRWIGSIATSRFRAPRVCGDDPMDAFVDGLTGLCSPRMRG